MASIKAIQSCGELCARIDLQVFLFRKMTHDLTTAWNIPLASCFNRAMVYSCSANGVRVELLIYPRLDSLGAQVIVEGLASGIAVSAIHLHIPLFGLRVTDFGRFIETVKFGVQMTFSNAMPFICTSINRPLLFSFKLVLLILDEHRP